MIGGTLTNPLVTVGLKELNELTSSVAAEFVWGSLELLQFPDDVRGMSEMSCDIRQHLGAPWSADRDQALSVASTFIAAADVIEAVCDSHEGLEDQAVHAVGIRERGNRVLEALEEIRTARA